MHPWPPRSASSNISNLPWSQGSHRGVQPMPLPCTMRWSWRPQQILLLGSPAWPPESGGCNVRCGLLQSIARACTLRGITAWQDLHNGGFPCHVPPAPSPTARLASSLSVAALQNHLTCHSVLSLRHHGFQLPPPALQNIPRLCPVPTRRDGRACPPAPCDRVATAFAAEILASPSDKWVSP